MKTHQFKRQRGFILFTTISAIVLASGAVGVAVNEQLKQEPAKTHQVQKQHEQQKQQSWEEFWKDYE